VVGKLLDFLRKLRGADSSTRNEPTAPNIDEEGLEFFNSLSGELQVELSEPAQPIEGLMNLQAPPTARVVSVRLDLLVPNDDGEEPRSLNQDELDWVIFQQPHLQLAGEAGVPVRHDAPNAREFTIRDLVRVVAETERQTRGQTEWLGGIDVHHCFFEGIQEREHGLWEITWGS
jgi:hypothetical protein